MLVINTAFMTANLALETPKGVLFREIDAKSKHSENVLKTIDEMCQEGDIKISQIDVVAIVVGPGSFTGLRISASIAQALGCALNIKFIALSSLDIMSHIIFKNKQNSGDYVCVLNALSELYFVGYYNKNGIKIAGEQMINKQAFLNIKQEKFALQGDLNDEGLKFIKIISQDVYELAKEKKEKKEFVLQEDLMPVYLRRSQAEDNLIKNAYNSAFSDPRFPPVSKEEFLKIELKVSILSSPVKMKFHNEDDLLNQIVPFVDGLIIKDGHYQAVYLPSVWDQLPDKKDFLDSLKQKAGLSRSYFSETFEAFRFGTEYIF